MSALHIWNPYIGPDQPGKLEFILTRSDADAIAEGTKEFVEELLRDIGAKAEVIHWSIKPYRSNYYSDYLGINDWRGTWEPIWKVAVETVSEFDPLPEINSPWIETNAVDGSWLFTTRLRDDADINCLVISDFDDEEALRKVQVAIERGDFRELQERYSVGTPIFSRSEVLGKYKQLQIDLGKFPSEFFASGADYAESVIKLCKQLKGTTHYEGRLDE